MNTIQKTILFLILIFLNPIFAQKQISGNLKKDITFLFPNQQADAEILGVKSNPRQQELLEKFQIGIQKNYDWFLETIKNRKEGEKMAYHRNLGLTENEFNELNSYMDDIELKSIETGKIKISNIDQIIEFEAEGNLKILEAIKIDLKNNIVIIGEYQLEYAKISEVTETDNGFKSSWKGYTWKLEEPEDLDLINFKDVNTLNAKQYKFTLGKLDKNGKTIILIKGKEIKDGVTEVNFDIPITL